MPQAANEKTPAGGAAESPCHGPQAPRVPPVSRHRRALSDLERRVLTLVSWGALAGAVLSALLAIDAWQQPAGPGAAPGPMAVRSGDVAGPSEGATLPARMLRVHGVVRTTDGAPIANTSIRSSHGASEAASDSAGRYVLMLRDPEATTQLRFSAVGYASQDVELQPEWLGLEAIALDVTLTAMRRLADVSGQLRSVTGEPIASETVDLRSLEGGRHRSDESDSAGAFTIAGLPVGARYDLVIRPRGPHGSYHERDIRIPPEGLRLELVLDPLPTRRLTGRMVDVEGSPIPNLTLRLRGADPRKWPIELRSDGSGRFDAEGIPTGRLSFEVSSPQHVLRADARMEEGAPLDLLLDAGSRRLEGRVFHARGQPVPGARLQMLWLHRDGTLQSSSVRRGVSDAEGFFQFDGLGPGPHRLTVSTDGEDATSRRLEVERGVETLEIVLDAPRAR
jgi:hypothetical protein